MANRFWVGGTGNWNDTAHWSATTGGASGASVPTLADAVTIDNSSGAGTITIDVNPAECASFSTTNTTTLITLNFNGNTLNVYGAASLSSGITISSTGSVGTLNLCATTAATYNFNFGGINCSAINLNVQPTSTTLTTYTSAVSTAITFYSITISNCTFGTGNGNVTTTANFSIIGNDPFNNLTTTINLGTSLCTIGGNFSATATGSDVSIAFATSVVTATGTIEFNTTGYYGVAATALTTTASAGAALRSSGDIKIYEEGSGAKSSIALQALGNTVSTTVPNLDIRTAYTTTTISTTTVDVTTAVTITGPAAVTLSGNLNATSFSRSGGDLVLGAFTYTLRQSWYMQAGYVLTRSTSTVSITGVDAASAALDTSFDSGGYTYQNVAINGNTQTIKDTTGGSTALACAGTFTGTTLTNTYGVLDLTIGLNVTGALSLTGNSLVNRYFVRSSVYKTAASITRGSNTLTNVDFSDITFTGTAASGTSIGNCLGNTNITFTTAVTRYARASGDWSSTGVWSTTSGGATGATAPLPQDSVVFNAASGAITVNTADRRALGVNLFTTGFTGTINVNNTGARGSFIYGSIQVPATTTITGTDAFVFAGRDSLYNIDIRSAMSGVSVVVYGCGATYTLTNALSTTGNVSVIAGTFDLLANTLSCAAFNIWYTPYSAFIPSVSPDPSPITVNLNSNAVTCSGDIFNEWQNYPNTPQSVVTINATAATISVASIELRYAAFNTGSSTISLSGNIQLGYPAGNPSSFTGTANVSFVGGAGSTFSAWGGADVTCNSITTTSTMSIGPANFYMNTLTLGGNASIKDVFVATNLIVNASKSVITDYSGYNGTLNIGGAVTTLQNKALLLAGVNFSYYGSASVFQSNTFMYYSNVTVTSGTVIAPAVADMFGNTGITFIGAVKTLAYSSFSGSSTLPSDVTPGAVIIMWGGGGQAAKASTASTSNNKGGGSAAYAATVNAPLAAGGTIYVSAPSTTGKKTTAGSGATGSSSWVNYSVNTPPASTTDGTLAIGGGGGFTFGGSGGSAGSCFADYAVSGKAGSGSGASFYYAGTTTGTANDARGGGGGGGYSSAGAAGGVNGGDGGAAANGGIASGGTSGYPPTNGSDGIFGGGGGGGGAEVNTGFTTATSLTRTAGTSTATITSASHGIPTGRTVYLTITLVAGTWSYAGGGTLTINCSSPHSLTTGNTTYLTFTRTGGPGTFTPATGSYAVTVTSTTAFTVTATGSGSLPSSGTVVIGNGVTNNTQVSYTATVTGTNTFTILTGASSNIYAVATVKYRPINSVTASGGNGGAWEGVIMPDLYNNGSTGSLPAAGIGPGGGGGSGSGVYNTTYVLTGSTGSGGDGGVGAGGGGTGTGVAITGFTFGDGGAGGPGLIFIRYQVAQGTSQAGFVG